MRVPKVGDKYKFIYRDSFDYPDYTYGKVYTIIQIIKDRSGSDYWSCQIIQDNGQIERWNYEVFSGKLQGYFEPYQSIKRNLPSWF